MRGVLSRRHLVRGMAGAGLSAMVGRPGWAASASAAGEVEEPAARSERPSPVRLGMASYTFRTFDRARLIAAMETLRLVNLNVKDVHLPMGPIADVRAGAAELRAAGMKLTAVGTITFAKDEDADVRAKFEYARAVGVGVIVAAPAREVLGRLERFVREYDMRLAIHNHGPEDKVFPSPLDALEAVKGMDARMGCCVDVGHAMRAGTDPVAAIRRIGPRVFDVHMKDLAEKRVKESQVAVGEGLMPVRGIFEALIAIGYGGYVDLEYEIHVDDPMPGVIESITYERGVLAGMGYDARGAVG